MLKSSLIYLAFQSVDLSVPDERYFRSVSCAVNYYYLILYLFNEDCQQPMATSGFPH